MLKCADWKCEHVGYVCFDVPPAVSFDRVHPCHCTGCFDILGTHDTCNHVCVNTYKHESFLFHKVVHPFITKI